MPGGSERATQCTAYGCRAGSRSAVVTTSAAIPRERSQPANSGAWLAGPPTSGGQIPVTISTFTAAPPSQFPSGVGPRKAFGGQTPSSFCGAGASQAEHLARAIARDVRLRAGGTALDPCVEHDPHGDEDAARREHRAGGARRAPHGAEHEHERHERDALDPV